ncbi:ThuA domain-containing protein [Limisphaera ngatamarikiensis]|uniref:ThuA domain-containing protein n=1 Tax=Limisphaera ngatamarikiensis TaxID=1324935 RepID=A0A6M1RRA3_9BACT|nr:ThuA domain-containing protein [Limisphaera ngatamarikiensis]NGO39917.1 ThuA domain-containing protein [Limisphaera ngatamarikiensis]
MNRLLPTLLILATLHAPAAQPWLTFEPADGSASPHPYILLLAGDEEYRSEEGLPMLARLLAHRHGFRCTVLFSQNPDDGTIDPNNQTNVPGMHLLGQADLVILQFRFRELPDPEMRHFVDYLQAGKPLIALRTATHAFQYTRNPNSPYAHFDWRSRTWPGGFGQQVLGETWIAHHGEHGRESTRGLVDGRFADHPVLRGVRTVWGPTDVYAIRNLRPTDIVLMHGLVLHGMQPDAPPNYDKPLMPLVWIRDHTWPNGATTRALTSTIGAAVDLQDEDLRRLLVNACYWLTGRPVPPRADVTPVGDYRPSMFGFNQFIRGRKPADYLSP